MKALNILLLAASILATAPAFAAETKTVNAWEKMCETQGVLAACRKAGSLLEDKIVSSNDESAEEKLRLRLLDISRIGCAKRDLGSCDRLFENSKDSDDETARFAKDTVGRICADGQGKDQQAACARQEEYKESKNAAIDLVELEFGGELLTASK